MTSVVATRADYIISLTITGDPKCSGATNFVVFFDDTQQTGTYSSGDTITVDHCGSIAVKVQYADPTTGVAYGTEATDTASKCGSE